MNQDKPPVGKIKYKAVDRSQTSLQVLDYEGLIESEPPGASDLGTGREAESGVLR